ncbi:KH domain-containing protein [Evansella sp. AB-rgal1]|uniref:KH domain-containing protein n=1 Tax=Evansella sp. AB-rgal1 TaxID=3242696 RepID=UPI00359E5B34
MKVLVESIAKALVDHPEDVRVTEVENGRSLTLKLEVHADDMGKVIGKQGRIAKAIRSVVNAAGANKDKRINLEIG